MSEPALGGPVFGIDDSGRRFATPMERLIYLRSIPGLAAVGKDGLMYLAQRTTEHFFPAGTEVFRPDRPVEGVHFVVEGVIRVWQEGRHLLDADTNGGIGFQPVLSGSTIGQRAVALVDCVTLEIRRDHLFEMMEDDFAFFANGIRQLASALISAQRELDSRGLLERSEPEDVPYPTEPLDLVQRLSRFDRGPFADVNLEGLVHLVRRYPEVRLPAGTVLWEEGDPATWGLHVVYGVVSCESEERQFKMGPDSVVGVLESYSEEPRSYRAVADTEVVALRADVSAFFDVLEDNFDIAVGFMEFLSKIVLRLSVQLAEARDSS
ncbi:MAG: CRP-like cAMP-binding protein [Bradymonadia bacterium]|jgi:CRP-like cAMP-binding protein